MRIGSLLLFAISACLLSLRAADAQVGYGDYVDSNFVLPSNAFLPPDPLNSCYPSRPEAWLGTFDFDFMLLQRSRTDWAHLVTVDGARVLNAHDLNRDPAFGFRVTATIPANCGCDLQMSYLTSHGFHDSVQYSGTDVQDTFFDITGSITDLDFQFDSDLDSLELNVRSRQWETVAPIAGLRIIQIDETARQFDLTSGLLFTGNADNELYGLQFGADAVLANWGRVRLESTVKGGVYYNDINILGDTASDDVNRSFSHIAFVGDITIAGVYQISPRHALRAGWQTLLFDGVALLFDQYDEFSVATNSGSVDLGRVGYYGAFFSFEATW